jgi:UDP-2,3-diacylglucosamine pyrophosphatase LpxH
MAQEKKTIVISDVHMSNGQPYSWFQQPNSKNLTRMLKKIAQDSSVGELVLLGDLFDLWLYPVNEVPWTVRQIIDANPSVTEALRLCVEKIPNVYYMNGNHDMAVVPSDLDPFTSGGKNIQWIRAEDYTKQHKSRRLEHGHAADMFNAPDDSGDTIGGYPLGYFITRLVATAANQSQVWKELRKLCEMWGAIHLAVAPPPMAAVPKGIAPELLAVPSLGPLLVEAIITLLEKFADVHDETPIRFSEEKLDKEKFTVGDIKGKYGSLYSRWHAKYQGTKLLEAMLATRSLDWYANDLVSANAALKVVVMGHTHASTSDGRYDNDGCWCMPAALGHGDGNPTLIEIVGDEATVITWE